MLQLDFIYFAPDSDDPIHICTVKSPVVPSVGETIMLNQEFAESHEFPQIWDVVDVAYPLPVEEDQVISHVIVYLEPNTDDDEAEE